MHPAHVSASSHARGCEDAKATARAGATILTMRATSATTARGVLVPLSALHASSTIDIAIQIL